jgi:hypothetical protein
MSAIKDRSASKTGDRQEGIIASPGANSSNSETGVNYLLDSVGQGMVAEFA